MVAAMKLAEKHLLRILELLREETAKMEEIAKTAEHRRYPMMRDGRVVDTDL